MTVAPAVAASLLLLLITVGSLGARLLALARRTRKPPELLLGLCFLSATVGLPLLVVSGIGRFAVGEMRLPALAAGLFCLWLAMSCFAWFAWATFRRRDAWAAVLATCISALAAASAVGAWVSITSAPPELNSGLPARGWLVGLRVAGTSVYLWSGLEAFAQFAQARRRFAIGLGDALVTNRFLLWGCLSSFTVVNSSLATAFQFAGMSLTNSAVGAGFTALGALVNSSLYCLVLLPPERYRRWIARRAAAA